MDDSNAAAARHTESATTEDSVHVFHPPRYPPLAALPSHINEVLSTLALAEYDKFEALVHANPALLEEKIPTPPLIDVFLGIEETMKKPPDQRKFPNDYEFQLANLANWSGAWAPLVYFVGTFAIPVACIYEPPSIDESVVIQFYKPFLDRGCALNATTANGKSALTTFVRLGCKKVCRFILENSSRDAVNQMAECGNPACHNEDGTETRHSLLYTLRQYKPDDVGLCKLLIEFGITIEQSEGYDLLETAIFRDQPELARTLLEAGVNPNPFLDDQVFLEPDTREKQLPTPLQTAIEFRRPLTYFDMLLQFGVKLYCPGRMTPLAVSLIALNCEAAYWLLEHGADPNGAINGVCHFFPPLLLALQASQYDMATDLISKYGANVNMTTRYSKLVNHSILDSLIFAEMYDAVKFLLDHGAHTNTLITSIPPPIFHLVIKQNYELLRLLLDDANANAEVVYQNKSLLQWATQCPKQSAPLGQKIIHLIETAIAKQKQKMLSFSSEAARDFFTFMYGSE